MGMQRKLICDLRRGRRQAGRAIQEIRVGPHITDYSRPASCDDVARHAFAKCITIPLNILGR